MQLSLIDLWPNYDTRSGYKLEKYDSKKDQIERVNLLIESWKKTALDHQFSAENVEELSCVQCDGAHQLTFLHAASEIVTRKVKIQNIEVDVSVDEDLTETRVNVLIEGKNFETGVDFNFCLTVYRTPTIRVYTSAS